MINQKIINAPKIFVFSANSLQQRQEIGLEIRKENENNIDISGFIGHIHLFTVFNIASIVPSWDS